MNKENMKEVPMVTLEELTAGIQSYNKLLVAEVRIKQLQEAGNKLAFLMLNGSTDEMRKALWEWRELNPKKDDSSV